MADAFRGLTLRLGADATPVNRAINSITKSAGAAQKQLNKMEKALKFDSTNAAALASRIDIADDKARHMASALKVARDAIKQAGKETVAFSKDAGIAGGRLDEVSANIKDAYSQTQKLRQGFTGVNSALQHVNEAMAKVYEKQNKVDSSTAIKEVLKLRQAGKSARKEIEALLTAVASGETGQNAFKDLEGDATALIGKYDKLRAEQKRFQSDLEAMESVEGFRALTYGEIEYESALREAVAETVRFKAEAASVKNVAGFKEAAMAARSLDNAVEEATNNMRVMNAAYDKLPASVESARNKVLATRDAQQALTQQAKHLEDAIKAIQNSPGFEKLKDGTKNVHLEFARASEAATKAGADFKDAQAKVKAFEDELLDAKTSMNGLSEGGRGVDAINDDLMKANQELHEMAANAREADAALEKAASHRDLANLKTQLAGVKAELADIKTNSSILTSFGRLGKGLREFGFGAYASITPAITMAGRYAIQAAENIDSSYRDMRKTVNGTEEDFESLKNAALEFSTTHVTSASQILDIEAIGGQLGIAVDDLEAFSHTVSNLDIATNMDTEDIALDLAKLSNIMHFTSDEYDSFADALVRLGNNEPALESDIMKISTRFAGMASNVNMTTSDMLGLATAATATGQKAEAAGSSMQRTISRIEGAVASGGDALDEYARISGMTADEFAAQWKDRPAVAIQRFVEGLKSIKDEGGSVDQTLVGLGITGVRDKQLLAGLTNTTNVLAESLGMAYDAWNGMSTNLGARGIEQAGDAMREAERKSEGFSGELGKMRNQAMYLANAMADGAAPIIHDLGQWFGDLAKAVGGMSNETKTAVVGFAGIVAAAGPVAVGLGTVLTSVTQIADAFGGMKRHLNTAGASLTTWGDTVLAGEKGMARAGKAASGFGKALSFIGTGPGMLAAVAGTTALSLCISSVIESFQKAAESQAAYEKATVGVKEASDVSLRLMQSSSSVFDDLIQKPQSAAMSYQQLVEAQGKLVDSMNSRNETAQNEIGLLNGAEEALTRYLGKTNLTATEQQKLKAAVELLNEKYNQNLSIVDLENGKVADNTGKILENASAVRQLIEEKKLAAKIDVLAANLAEQEVAADNAAASYAKAAKEYDSFVQAMGDWDPNTFTSWGEYSGTVAEVGASLKRDKDAALEFLDASQSAADETSSQLDAITESSDRASASISNLVKNQGAVSAYFGTDEAGLSDFTKAIEECGLTVDDFYNISSRQWADILERWAAGGSDMATILEDVGVSTRTLGEQFASEFTAAGGSIDELNARVQDFPGKMEAFAQSMSDAGISAQDFAAMGIGQFDALYAAAEGDFSNLGSLIDTLNSQGIDPKTVNIDGSQITDANGKVYTLEATADEMGKKTYSLTVVADASQAQGDLSGTADAAESIPEEESVDVYTTGDEASSELDGVTESANEIPETEQVTVSVDDQASTVLDSIITKLGNIQSKEVTVTVKKVETEGGNASGGILRAYKTGALFPRHADGGMNGIVTRATMTNVGWVGEAGAEAVFHMRHAGGAIVPLSNRRYVRPFARAVASEMGGGSTRNVNVTVNLDYKAGDDANKMARDISRRINAYMNMEA